MDVYVHESRRPAAGARGAIAMLADARVEATVPTVDLDRAREFYEARLGLRPAGTRWATPGAIAPGREVLYECGAATRLLLYERPSAGHAEHTLAHFTVADVEAAVDELRGRGVTFEEYDLPNIKTVEGVARAGNLKAAWFKDPDGNVIGIHN